MPACTEVVVSVAPRLLSDTLRSALQAASFEVVQPVPEQSVHASLAIVTGPRPPWIRCRCVLELPGPDEPSSSMAWLEVDGRRGAVEIRSVHSVLEVLARLSRRASRWRAVDAAPRPRSTMSFPPRRLELGRLSPSFTDDSIGP